MSRQPEHEILGVDATRKGWSARCTCGVRLPVRREQDTAWGDAADHMVAEREAAIGRRYRRPTTRLRALLADGELQEIVRLGRAS